MYKSMLTGLFLLAEIAGSMAQSNSVSSMLKYPQTRKTDQIDEYHGTKVADPYRWLEDDRSAETGAWVKAQNAVTFGYLEQIPYRKQIEKRLEQIINYPRYSAPGRKNDWFYFYKNDGLQNQSVLYRQKGLNGVPEVVIDPNKLAADGTTRLTSFDLSKDGRYAAYALSKAGSDWQEIFVMDMQTLKSLPDKLEWVKFTGAAWQGDGFYYSRYDKPGAGQELSSKNEFMKVYFHRRGTAQSADELIYEDKTHPLRYFFAQTTEDERFLILNISEGTDGSEIWYKDSQAGDKQFKRLFEGFKYNYSVVDNLGDQLLVYHNNGAPNYKVSKIDPKTGALSDFVGEKPEKLDHANTAGGKLFVNYLKDVTSRIYVYDLSGKLENEVQLPGLGTVSGFGGEKDDSFVFYTFTSFTFPPTIYRYEIATKKTALFRAPEVDFKPTDYETKQVFFNSKDGTRVPMFLTYRKGLKLDGTNPTMLYGYGGFNISLTPAFSALLIPFLEQGGIYASMNLRGGSEYGETWHEQGMKLKKQNVFDDCIAAAEYLIAQKYTSPQKLALRGGSNGGLLVGAVINQRPDLFRVAIPQVGVMDMLRFHKFTVGWGWVSDYGSSDNADEFKAIYAYSPIHNIKTGIKYPATMITTADHDDRVVPAHSFKYAATLQELYKGPNPALIRIETNSGHGASNTKKNIETMADIYAFTLWNMGVKVLK
ncbi:prolyl oligopeptidase family serine peptidase [Larkinella terrae]|uniref:prolyl oligopeptidase n=1 Tax=Larkinella terrae TaxID=2025311 RepID=A0A7K0EF42_9BACT|nr:prolyl oligopeptidase family serine peptidase [Larkinella terrae]MRS60365.1 prolyl oligopeptidase family serine peptidase [Larkinella terrae]